MLFRTLPESAPLADGRRRRPLTALASAATHLILIAGAIMLTRESGESRSHAEPQADEVVYVANRDAEPGPAGPRRAAQDPPVTSDPIERTVPPVLRTDIVPDGLRDVTLDLLGASTPGTAFPIDGARTTTTGGGAGDGGIATDFLPLAELGALVAGAAPTVRYPLSLQRAGIGGRVILEVVIDSTGRPEASTVRVIASAHVLFTDAARSALLRTRFVPARVAERAVRVRVRMPYDFEVAAR